MYPFAYKTPIKLIREITKTNNADSISRAISTSPKIGEVKRFKDKTFPDIKVFIVGIRAKTDAIIPKTEQTFSFASSLTNKLKIPPKINIKIDIIMYSIIPRANVKSNFLQDCYSPNKSKKQVLY